MRGRLLLMNGPDLARITLPSASPRGAPMFGFLKNVVSTFRTPETRSPRPTLRRALLRVECLEDRMVPTSITQTGSTLLINNIPQSHTIILKSDGQRHLQVFDNGSRVDSNQTFNIGSIISVNIQVSGSDTVKVDDSNGMPFAQGAAITLLGSGGNLLTLAGSRTVSGNETYIPGNAPSVSGLLQMDNLTFNLVGGITTVADTIAITGTLDVQTSGLNAGLTAGFLASQQLYGLGYLGGTFDFSNKPTVVLDEYAANAWVDLVGTGAPPASEKLFEVLMHGAGDTTTIGQTASGVITSVVAEASSQYVNLSANVGTVYIQGNQSTSVTLGTLQSPGVYSTLGIQGNVSVGNVGHLGISDSYDTRAQNVTVTDTTIFGSGIFGNNNVKVSYNEVAALTIIGGSGRQADEFIVTNSSSSSEFATQITILDNSNASFRVDAYVNAHSNLHLLLINDSSPQGSAELVIHPTNVSVTISGTPSGVADIFANGLLNSQLTFVGFGEVL
jgi:hypothetical protein